MTMRRLASNDFSGGIQESYSPDDFTTRQWAQLKGIVPTSETRFESQWPLQRIGAVYNTWVDHAAATNTSPVNAIFPLNSISGSFLVAIKADGTVWWCKAPASDSTGTTTVANAIVWTELTNTVAQNAGWNSTSGTTAQPSITISQNSDYRFITGMPFEAYKYLRQPYATYLNQPNEDEITDGAGTTPKSIVSGVLIHSRRYYSGSNLIFGNTIGGSALTATTQVAIVAYVDPYGNSGAGSVKAVTFPNMRRWPQYTTGNAVTGTYGPVLPFVSTTKKVAGTVTTILNQYPFSSVTGYPRNDTVFHPFTYLDGSKALQAGSGFIPRSNVGAMWGQHLILGDIEYRPDAAITAGSDVKVSPAAWQAPIGTGANQQLLRDGNTEPHRGWFWYSEYGIYNGIDTFDTRSALAVSGTDTRIAGMHVIDNRLVCITTAGGESDGVITMSGNLSELHSYDPQTPSNPFSIRKQIVKGNLGVADYPDGIGHVQQTCLWTDANSAVFIDRLGGIYTTNGESCDRIDRFGPKQPTGSTYNDHVASVGKHLFAWRNKRLMLFTILSADSESSSGCWTELVVPTTVTTADQIKSMVGARQSLYMVVDGSVWRYALNGPQAERGRINNVQTDITISTSSYGTSKEFSRINWHRFGIGFYTEDGCSLQSLTINGAPALQASIPVSYAAISTPRSYTAGYHDVVVPAGVGTQQVVSATYVVRGQIILESAGFWYTGQSMERGEKP